MDDEKLLGDLMSEISQQNYCATWCMETLSVCKQLYNGADLSPAWWISDEQRAELVRLRDKLGYWVSMNMVSDTPEYVRVND